MTGIVILYFVKLNLKSDRLFEKVDIQVDLHIYNDLLTLKRTYKLMFADTNSDKMPCSITL